MKYADKRILIVEDQRPFLMLLRGLLNSMGATDVVICGNADQAVASCRKHKFDIVIADLHLGNEKKNGFELIEELRVRKLVKPSTILLIISADSARPVVLGSIERRPDDYIVKPFSQAQLKSRLQRAWVKRQYMLPIYSAILDDNWDNAITQAQLLASESTPLQRHVNQLLVELYWHIADYPKALALIEKYITKKTPLWAQVAQGKTLNYLQRFEEAQAVAVSILSSNRFSAEAYDILAEAQNNLDKGDEAIDAIKQAIKISPYSLQRHLTACNIAKQNNDYPLLTEASLSIWHLSKRTVHQDVSHWCNHMRSILDAAEHATDKSQKNRYQQEAILLVQRGKYDDSLVRYADRFDIAIYEELIHARIAALDGKMLDAKKQLMVSQQHIERKFGKIPSSFAPDSLKLMYDIGEWEEAQSLGKQLNDSDDGLDTYTQQLIQHESALLAERQANYTKHNKEGIELYQQGKFEQAKAQFSLALEFSPVNSGVALNLIQCILKILDKGKKPEPLLVKECRRIYKVVDGMPLRQVHQDKLKSLQEDIERYLGK